MISAKSYVGLFFITRTVMTLFFTSILLIWKWGWLLRWLIVAIQIGLTVFVSKVASSRRLSFMEGLERIVQANMSGCVNITMIYLFPVLFMVHWAILYHSLIGLKRGKEYTEGEWLRIVREYELTAPFS